MRDDDILNFICEIHQVDDETAAKIWEHYFPKLVSFARNKLGTIPRRVFDEEDIAVSAMKSFFRGANEGRFDFKDRSDLWNLLMKITVRKVTAERRRFFAKKRGEGKVSGGSIFRRGPNDSQQAGFEQVIDGSLMPELVEDVIRACDDLLSMLPHNRLQKTAILKMEGHTNQEIADTLGCSVARIKQLLAEIRSIWQSVDIESAGTWGRVRAAAG